ncbi:MAG TPA: hypothetical protein VGD43_11990, partial [Micromonospora sp.]
LGAIGAEGPPPGVGSAGSAGVLVTGDPPDAAGGVVPSSRAQPPNIRQATAATAAIRIVLMPVGRATRPDSSPSPSATNDLIEVGRITGEQW